MSCSVIIKDMRRECERRVCVDSEEEMKNMNVEEFIRRVCPEDQWHRNCLYFKKSADDQTRGDCDRKHESGCSGDISNQSIIQGSESVDFPHDRSGSVTDCSVSPPIPPEREERVGGGIQETVEETIVGCSGSSWLCTQIYPEDEDEDEGAKRRPPLPEDEDKIIPRSHSMDNLFLDLQRPQ